jgi:integrase
LPHERTDAPGIYRRGSPLPETGRAGAPARRGTGEWRPLFELLAATGLRISEAVGLCWSDLVLDGSPPHLRVRRAIVKRAVVAPKSRHGARLTPSRPSSLPRYALIGSTAPSTTRSSSPVATALRRIRAA